MDDRTRYETVKSRLRAMGEGTAQQVHDSMEPTPYSVREVENTLDEMALAEQDDFEKAVTCIAGKNTIAFVFAESAAKAWPVRSLRTTYGQLRSRGK